MARTGLDLTTRQFAELSGLDKTTIVRLEAGDDVPSGTEQRIRDALESAGARFYDISSHDRVCVEAPNKTFDAAGFTPDR